MATAADLVEKWRGLGPARWAENRFGWVLETGEPIRLEPWQAAVLAAWWEHRADVSEVAVSSIKKVGKTTLNAIMVGWRWLVLGGEHFVCGNDLDQSDGRQFKMVAEMVKRHPVLASRVKATRHELTFEPTGAMLTALAVDAAGNAGANHWTASHTESWGISSELATRAYEELTPPPGRRFGLPAIRICDSYAGHLGESTVWHKLVDRGLSGERVAGDWPIYRAGGLLLFHMEGEEAQRRCFRGGEQERATYYANQARELRAATFTRLHLNRRTQSEGSFIDPAAWAALVDPNHAPLEPGSGEPVFVGLDLALAPGGDDCALIGVYRRGDGKVAAAFHRVWRGRQRRARLRLAETVEPAIRLIARCYNLRGVWYDPYQAIQLSENLQRSGIVCNEVPQTHATRGPRDSALWQMAVNGELVLYDDPDLAGMAANAGAKELGNGQIFIVKGGRGKIDLLVALSNVADVARGGGGWYVA